MMRSILLKSFIFFSLTWIVSISAQNTVGVLLNEADALNGYTLFTVHEETYLINNCGEAVNQWSSNFKDGKSVYLLENGNLLRAAKIDNPGNIAIPGVGGRIELFDWDNNLLWEFDFTTDTRIQHHDIFPMPNGNVLVLAASILTEAEAIQMGRDPANLVDSELYNEHIVEIEPVGTNNANTVWEWHQKDHLIQDFDNTKDNFGIVGNNPQLLDINFLGLSNGKKNWMHINSMQYNEQLDQIILSTRLLSEFYIIDHSTTTAQAATSLGGTYQKGGDFLYRWGNPLAYKQGTIDDQILDGQHFPHWIVEGLTDAGKIILFNNGFTRTAPDSFSEVFILDPPTSSPGVYTYMANTAYGPNTPDYIYTTPVKTDFYSPLMSSAQRLPNGNTLICEGSSGHFFEIDANENIVWRYINPASTSGILSQGDDPESINNNIFRAIKYPTDYPAFNDKDLSPGPPIEINPDLSQCDILSVADIQFKELSIYPNPVVNTLKIISDDRIEKIEVYDVQGRKINIEKLKKNLNFTEYSTGVYFLKVYTDKGISTKKIIKI
jgi:hypothetical protein